MAGKGGQFIAIRSWYASLYIVSSRKWAYGNFILTPTAIYFEANKTDSGNSHESPHTLYIEYSDINSINKAMSSLVFPAITIIMVNGTTHWFSSFKDRNSSFLTIQHFYQAFLLQKSVPQASDTNIETSNPTQQRTKFGTELLRSVYDSQATLQKAAGTLLEQGHQLRGAACTMEDIHQDLNVVDRLTAGLDSWLGRWSMPKAYKAEELILVKDNDIPDVLDVEVLSNQILGNKIGSPVVSVLRLAKDGVSILDMKQKIIQFFKWSDVSRIRVVSPWEILITRFLIGQPDLSYDVVSMSMPAILRRLGAYATHKMEYMNPPETCLQQQSDESRYLARAGDEINAFAADEGENQHAFSSGSDMPADTDLTQQQELKLAEKQVISDAEVSELSATLTNLKSLALDIQEEQDDQLQTIDRLSESVTRGNERLKTTNKKINKLLK